MTPDELQAALDAIYQESYRYAFGSDQACECEARWAALAQAHTEADMAAQRIIENTPQSQSKQPWHGRLEPDVQTRAWHGPNIGHVIADMNKALGEAPEDSYVIREGGAHA